MDDVTWETPEAEWKTAVAIEKSSGDGDDGAEDQEGATEFAQRVHKRECKKNTGRKQRLCGIAPTPHSGFTRA
jgi:hypothetical protein